MTTIEAALAVRELGCHLLRQRKDAPAGVYDGKPYGEGGSKRGWFYLDAFTAGAILAVYDALSPENRTKFGRLPITVAARFAMKHCG